MNSPLVAVAVACLLVVAPVSALAEENDPPLADAGLDQDVPLGSTVWLDGGGSLDPDGDLVGYEWTVTAPDGTTVAVTGADARTASFDARQVGRYEVTLRVRDDDGSTRTDTLFVDVTDEGATAEETGDGEPAAPVSNEAPVGTIDGPDRVRRGTTVTFIADAYDPDGEIVSYAWSDGTTGREHERVVDGPAGERFGFSVTLVDDDGAVTTLRKSVRVLSPAGAGGDGRLAVDTTNRPPELQVDGPERVAVGETAAFVMDARDPDGEVVSRRWTEPAAATGGVLRHEFTEPGTYTVRATVMDDDGGRATAGRSVEVYDEGPPVVRIDGPDSARTGSSQRYTVDAYDPDGGPVTISWSPGQNALEREANPFVNHVEIDGIVGDTVEVASTVTDDEGNQVMVVKETAVSYFSNREASNIPPYIGALDLKYYTDESWEISQDRRGDKIEQGTYSISAPISYDEGKFVRVTWKINDTPPTTMTDSISRVADSTTSRIKHTFLSKRGRWVNRQVVITATSAEGASSTKRQVIRVKSVQTNDKVVFQASGPEESADRGQLSIRPGERVRFRVGSHAHFKLELGDGSMIESKGSPGYIRFEHVYESAGTYTARLISNQGDRGEAVRTVVIRVSPDTYREYWYEVEDESFEQVHSEARPNGAGWSRLGVVGTETRYTGRKVESRTDRARLAVLDESWRKIDKRTVRRQYNVERIARTDPDGPGDRFRLDERAVRNEKVTRYVDRYRWYGAKFEIHGWEPTGKTRSERVVVGDGHDHDKQRHERTTRTCAERRLEFTRFGLPQSRCVRWSEETEVWYTGHDHDGGIRWDTEYQYHKAVPQTETVTYHRYIGTRTETFNVETYAETVTTTEWLWQRTVTNPVQEFGLTRPEDGAYIDGSLTVEEVRCGADRSHFDEVMC